MSKQVDVPPLRFRFTEARLRDLLPAPSGKRLRYHDEAQPGLCLRVTDTGTKSFKLYRKMNGKPVDVTLLITHKSVPVGICSVNGRGRC